MQIRFGLECAGSRVGSALSGDVRWQRQLGTGPPRWTSVPVVHSAVVSAACQLLFFHQPMAGWPSCGVLPFSMFSPTVWNATPQRAVTLLVFSLPS